MMQSAINTHTRTEVVNVAKAAALMGVHATTITRAIEAGKLQADSAISLLGGGNGGTAYRIHVDSLPADAQIRYWQESAVAEVGAGCREFDLVGYRERKGEAGMAELLRRQRAALAAHGLRMRFEEHYGLRGYTEALGELAERFDVPMMTLYRWERGYASNGLAGIARPIRADAGQSRSMCLLARDYVEFLMCDQRKPPQTRVLEKVRARAQELGPEACEDCPYRRASAARIMMQEAHGEEMPLCDQVGNGMIPPENRHAVNRAIDLIPQSVLAYARYGSRYWDAKYLQKVQRAKPTMANEVWFGDHHKLDLFVLDRDGRAVRPWLTAWMDAMSGSLVGWMLTLEPNSDTVAESFARGAVATKGSPFRGLPRLVYIDNGKDYRSTRFEGGVYRDQSIGNLNAEFAGKSMLETLRVEVKHAIPYWAWTKPIERMFGTLEMRWMRDFPGWCGDSPDARPQDLAKDIRDGKIMTFRAFAECFQHDVIDQYHNYRSEEDGRTPLERYQAAERARTDDPDWATMSLLKSQTTTRVVRTQGVSIDGVLYQHRALADLIGEGVTIKHNRGVNVSVTVLHRGQFVCEAECAEMLDMIERDEDKLGAVMADKRRQRRTVTGRIAAINQHVRGVHREAYTEEIDEQRDRAMARVGSLEGRKAQKAKAEVAARRRKRAGDLNEGERRVDAMFGALGEQLLRRAEEG